MSALYAVLREVVRDLPAPLRAFHASDTGAVWTGTVTVEQGGAIARLLCRAGGFPPAGAGQKMRMSITADGDGEIWHREFSGHVMRTRVRQLDETQIAERLGPFEVRMRPHIEDGALRMPVTGLRVLGIPLPAALLGGSGGREEVTADGRIAFHVRSRLIGLGPLITYHGTLERTLDTGG